MYDILCKSISTVYNFPADKPLFKTDPIDPDITYFTGDVIEEVITPGKDQQVVVGEEEEIGFKATLTATVPEGMNVTFIVQAVFRSQTPPVPSFKPDPPATQDKPDVAPHEHESVEDVPEPSKIAENLEPVSLMYAIQASGAEWLEKILVEIAHSAVIETDEDKENMFFLVFRFSDSVNSTLEFVGIKKGVFKKNSEGDPIGVVELESSDLETKVFIELARKILLSFLPTVSQTTPYQTSSKSKSKFPKKKDN